MGAEFGLNLIIAVVEIRIVYIGRLYMSGLFCSPSLLSNISIHRLNGPIHSNYLTESPLYV